MITTNDPKLAVAINNLRKNPKLAPFILEMDAAGLNIFIVQAPPTSKGSYTDVYSRPVYHCYINTKGDAATSWEKYKITLTTEENSIAHELGHVYFDYLLYFKKPASIATALKPPSVLTLSQWEEVLDETMSRRFELYSRPPGTILPLKDPRAESVLERLDFTPFPLSLFKK